MTVSAIDSSSTARLAAMYASGASAAPAGSPGLSDPAAKAASGRDPAAIKKAASQFEAIILRQLLEPSMSSIMSGGLGASEEGAGGGGNVYGYMLTDALAGNLAQSGGLGLAGILEKQLTPSGSAASNAAAGQATTSRQLNTLKTS